MQPVDGASPRIRPFLLMLLGCAALGACSGDATTAPAARAAGQIAYTSVTSGVRLTGLMNADGSDARTIGSAVYEDEAPVLSPDGRRIAVTSPYTGLPQLFVMALDGSGRTAVTNLPSGGLMGTWRPDGRALLFSSFDNRTYMINDDGSGLRVVGDDSLDEQFPVLSPDGTRIVFMTERNSTPDVMLVELYVMHADGSDPVRLTTTMGVDSAGVNSFPAWSPDGRHIAFIRALDGAPAHVWTIDADGTNLHQLFTGADVEQSVTWSPDGQRIAFARQAAGARSFDIYVANADGTDVRDVSNTSDVDEIFPNWGRKP